MSENKEIYVNINQYLNINQYVVEGCSDMDMECHSEHKKYRLKYTVDISQCISVSSHRTAHLSVYGPFVK